jgi:hypothetical protein
MNAQMIDDVRRLLLRELAAFRREIEQFDDDDTMWGTLPGITNSAGNLTLHVCGGLLHFVGAVFGQTGYQRDRDAEFASRNQTREDVCAVIDTTMHVVDRTLTELDAGVLDRPISTPLGQDVRTGIFLLHLATHASFHLGQAGYLRRVLTGKGTSVAPVALAPLVD